MPKKKNEDQAGETVYYRFYYYGDANTLERWWSMGFSNDLPDSKDKSVCVNLTRGVPEAEAHIRMGNGHKLVNEIIGDIRVPTTKGGSDDHT